MHTLWLVFPPVSCQEAQWIKNDNGVQERLASSNLYMIAKRMEVLFVYKENEIRTQFIKDKSITIQLQSRDIIDTVTINFSKIIEDKAGQHDVALEMGSKIIRLWVGEPHRSSSTLICWYTPDFVLTAKGHKESNIQGLEKLYSFVDFELLYVGISKKQDSLRRLMLKSHKTLQDILINERPSKNGANLVDEIVILFCGIKDLFLGEVASEKDILKLLQGEHTKPNKIVADAEKALVSIFKPKYNNIQFSKYPAGADGLSDVGIDGHSFVFGEDLNLYTSSSSMRGAHDWVTEAHDYIQVKDKCASMKKSSV
jgi:hypothetical protein